MVNTAVRTLENYLALHELAGVSAPPEGTSDAGLLAGWFVFFPLLAAESPLPLSASIAGAASLGIAPSVEDGNRMLRLGLCDFVVRSLDESLRILKNELRKKQPVSVVVTDSHDAVQAEMAERGVAPDLTTAAETLTRANPQGWIAVRWRAKAIFPADAAVAAALPQDDRLRRRWIAASPRFLPRTLPIEHVCMMSEPELAAVKEHSPNLDIAEVSQ